LLLGLEAEGKRLIAAVCNEKLHECVQPHGATLRRSSLLAQSAGVASDFHRFADLAPPALSNLGLSDPSIARSLSGIAVQRPTPANHARWSRHRHHAP